MVVKNEYLTIFCDNYTMSLKKDERKNEQVDDIQIRIKC